jgi:hypothetical protein
VSKIVATNERWLERASIRRIEHDEYLSIVGGIGAAEASGVFDYPPELIPVRISELDEEELGRLARCAWHGYNIRTIAAEQQIAAPAFRYLAGLFQGSPLLRDIETALSFATIDEEFHTHLHRQAVAEVELRTDIDESLKRLRPSTVEALEKRCAEVQTQLHRQLTNVAYALVTELSINKVLTELSSSTSMRGRNTRLAAWHAEDEASHTGILLLIGRELYELLDESSREYLVREIHLARDVFMSTDEKLWSRYWNSSVGRDKELVLQTRDDLYRDMSPVDVFLRKLC